jgi:hypothetical protein
MTPDVLSAQVSVHSSLYQYKRQALWGWFECRVQQSNETARFQIHAGTKSLMRSRLMQPRRRRSSSGTLYLGVGGSARKTQPVQSKSRDSIAGMRRIMACLYRAGWLGEQQVGDKTFGSLGRTGYGACQVWAAVTALGLLEGFDGLHERSGAAGWFGAYHAVLVYLDQASSTKWQHVW